MRTGLSQRDTIVSDGGSENDSQIVWLIAIACLFWCFLVILVSTIGCVQIWRFYSSALKEVRWDSSAPHVNIIRPVKGLEPFLYDCLVATFHLQYPKDKLHVRFCISSRAEPSFPILERLVKEFHGFDVIIYIEEEDPALANRSGKLGPNPKIRNMRRAYREAIGDVIWILDCNVWVSKVALGRMMAKLQHSDGRPKYKLVHQLPLTVHTGFGSTTSELRSLQYSLGSRLDEAFMSSAHAKFYTAINTVLIAPCIVGKSTIFRRSHLDSLTQGQGIDYFAQNICEDHLIGDLLWKGAVPEEKAGKILGKHALCFGDLAIQPITDITLQEYWNRRVRWLRVRKFTVALATFVEPGTECLLCSVYGSFAMTTLPFFANTFGIPSTWLAFFLLWCLSVTVWCLCDWALYCKLQSGDSLDVDAKSPDFIKKLASGQLRSSFRQWAFAWLGREVLALPIWSWAVLGGTTVEWRGRRFKVGMDMKVHELKTTT